MVKNIFLAALFSCFCLYVLAQDSAVVDHTVFLVGDAGESYVIEEPFGEVLRKAISETKGPATVLFLGDNVYPKGVPEKDDRKRAEAEAILAHQASWIKGTHAKAYFIPGNHDWAHWGKDGYDYVRHQAEYIQSLSDSALVVLPADGCPGPVAVQLGTSTTLAILDTQWILHKWARPGRKEGCACDTNDEVLTALEEILRRNNDRRVIVAAHHPLITYGEHGGVFPLRSHIFPLLDLSHYLYVPLPVIGSIYPLYRKWFGHNQDTPHPRYRRFGKEVRGLLAQYPGSLYVAGHEHALQHIIRDSTHFIVSGSAAKTEFVRKKDYATFAEDVRGYVQLDLMTDATVIMKFVAVSEDTAAQTVVYTAMIR